MNKNHIDRIEADLIANLQKEKQELEDTIIELRKRLQIANEIIGEYITRDREATYFS